MVQFMLINFLQKNKFFREKIYKVGKDRALDMVQRIEPFLNKESKILDIGSGSCNVCEILMQKGYDVTPLDVQNLSFVDNIAPIIYDGNKIPFKDDEFEFSLILTVMHHTPNPEKILAEAKRVSKKIIIIEDIYESRLHKYITYFMDSLLNLEFFGHPHTNKNDKEWKETFQNMELKLVEAKYNKSFVFFRHATYYLEKY